MEMFLENALNIASVSSEDDTAAVLRLDLKHFKQVNDNYGFDAGDNVIVAFYDIIKSNVGKHLANATIARAHGDEFIVFCIAGRELVKKTADSIIENMKTYDFSKIGCGFQITCHIGGMISRKKSKSDIRNMIDYSIEVISGVRNSGKVIIEDY